MKFMNISLIMIVLPVFVCSERACASNNNEEAKQPQQQKNDAPESAAPPFTNPPLSRGATVPPQSIQQPPPAYSFPISGAQLGQSPTDQFSPLATATTDPRFAASAYPGTQGQPAYNSYPPQQHPIDIGPGAYALHQHHMNAFPASYPPLGHGYAAYPNSQTGYDPRYSQPSASFSHASYAHPGMPEGQLRHPSEQSLYPSNVFYSPPPQAGIPVQGPSSANASPLVLRRRPISGGDQLSQLSLHDGSPGSTATDDGCDVEETDDEGTGEHALDLLKKDRKALAEAWASLSQIADAKETALAALLQARRKSVSAGEKSPKEKSPTSFITGAKKAYQGVKKVIKGTEAMEEEKLAQEEEDYESKAKPAKKLLRKERRQYHLLTGHIQAAVVAISALSLEIPPKK